MVICQNGIVCSSLWWRCLWSKWQTIHSTISPNLSLLQQYYHYFQAFLLQVHKFCSVNPNKRSSWEGSNFKWTKQWKSPVKIFFLNCQNHHHLSILFSEILLEIPSKYFRSHADKLYILKKIAVSTADNIKYWHDEFLKAVNCEHKEKFLKFNRKEGRLHSFLGISLSSEDSLRRKMIKNLFSVCESNNSQ